MGIGRFSIGKIDPCCFTEYLRDRNYEPVQPIRPPDVSKSCWSSSEIIVWANHTMTRHIQASCIVGKVR